MLFTVLCYAAALPACDVSSLNCGKYEYAASDADGGCKCKCHFEGVPDDQLKHICTAPKVFSSASCKCVCQKQVCTSAKKWDEDTCNCVCKNSACPPGSYQDAVSCLCFKNDEKILQW